MTSSQKVSAWSRSLRGIAVLNILIWVLTCAPLALQSGLLRFQVALSGIYVAVCAFRSWLPRVDLERYCLVDSPLSSMFVGRSAATIAEVAFAAQVAICLHQVGSMAGLSWVKTVSYGVVPALALAQCFCWYSVLTLNHLGHAIEQTLWTTTMAVVGVSLAASGPSLTGPMQWVAYAGAAIAFAFVAFMAMVDVPMYLRRWREGRARGATYLSLRAGLRDAIHRRIAVRDWNRWKPEVAWLTGYFSVAVWLSVAIVHFTRL